MAVFCTFIASKLLGLFYPTDLNRHDCLAESLYIIKLFKIIKE